MTFDVEIVLVVYVKFFSGCLCQIFCIDGPMSSNRMHVRDLRDSVIPLLREWTTILGRSCATT